MSLPVAPTKLVRLGVTSDESLLCVEFNPGLQDHELDGLPTPLSRNSTEPELIGWPRMQVFSPVSAPETLLVASRQTILTNMLRSTAREFTRREIEDDPYAVYKHLAKYASKIARGLHRQLVPVWFEAVPTEDNNKLVLGSAYTSRK